MADLHMPGVEEGSGAPEGKRCPPGRGLHRGERSIGEDDQVAGLRLPT